MDQHGRASVPWGPEPGTLGRPGRRGGAALPGSETEVLLGKPERGLRTAAVVVLVGGSLGLYGLIELLSALRPGIPPLHLKAIGILAGGAAFVALIAATVLLHEVLHAVPLAFSAGRLPRLGWKLPFFVSIAVPGVRLPRNAMIAVLLTPVAAGTAAGLAIVLLATEELVRPAKIAVLLNYIGSVLDVFGAVWLLQYPASTRVEDTPEGPLLYGPRGDVP